jgi:hypothetical protein
MGSISLWHWIILAAMVLAAVLIFYGVRRVLRLANSHTHLQAPDGSVVRVKNGFSWPAFFFGPFWALVKGAWRLLLLLVASFGALVLVDQAFVEGSENIFLAVSMLVAYVTYMVVCGRNGNTWLLWEFERKGYIRLPEDPKRQQGSVQFAEPN